MMSVESLNTYGASGEPLKPAKIFFVKIILLSKSLNTIISRS